MHFACVENLFRVFAEQSELLDVADDDCHDSCAVSEILELAMMDEEVFRDARLVDPFLQQVSRGLAPHLAGQIFEAAAGDVFPHLHLLARLVDDHLFPFEQGFDADAERDFWCLAHLRDFFSHAIRHDICGQEEVELGIEVQGRVGVRFHISGDGKYTHAGRLCALHAVPTLIVAARKALRKALLAATMSLFFKDLLFRPFGLISRNTHSETVGHLQWRP